MATLPVSQNKRRSFYRNAMYAAIAALAVCAIATRLFDVSMHIPSTLIVVAVGVLCVLQFNALDEVAKQAHYVAWYWGGLIGLSAMALLAIAIAIAPRTFGLIEALMLQWADEADSQTSFLFGLMVTPSLLLLGFAGWWSVYWLRRR